MSIDRSNTAIQQLLDDYVDQGLDGVSIAFSDRSGWSFAKSSGFADFDRTVPLTTDHLFKIASCTKPFTAAMLLALVERGELAIDAPVSSWLPELPAGDQITLGMLLSHRSGLPGFKSLPLVSERVWRKQELVDFALAHGTPRIPGAGWEYSNTGYVIAGMILERASGTSVARHVRNQYDAILDLSDLWFGSEETWPRERMARGIVHDEGVTDPIWNVDGLEPSRGGRWDATEWFDLSVAPSAGDIVASPHAIVGVLRALLDGRILKPASLEFLSGPVIEATMGGTEVVASGHGAMTMRLGGRGFNGHSGHMPGYTSLMTWHAPSGDALMICQNAGALCRESPYMADINALATRVWDVLRPHASVSPPAQDATSLQ